MAYIKKDGLQQGHKLTVEMVSALDSIATSPDWFPARLHLLQKRAWFVKMSPQWYRESVFLDPNRIKGTYVIETDWQWIKDTCEPLPCNATSVIFHTAFCGSTLMAQALDDLFNCLSLKEPDALSNLLFYLRNAPPEHATADDFDLVMSLLSRKYNPQQGVVIKANDYANPLITDLIQWHQHAPLLFMYTPLQEFLVGCLKADNRREWILGRYQMLNTTLQDVFGVETLSEINNDEYGKMAAVYWCYNISLFNNAWQYLQNDPHRLKKLRSLDFNTMLAEPEKSVLTCGDYFGLHALTNIDRQAQLDKLFGTYSKNNNFNYSAQQRNLDIQQVLNENPVHVTDAEKLARTLLGENYPETELPGSLAS